MILVDTSIWADHLAKKNGTLFEMLQDASVLMHPFVIGEIALGNLPQREVVLQILEGVPSAAIASTSEVLRFIERHDLAGSGVGYVDAHLVASALMENATLWTRDKRLRAVAERLGVAAEFN